MALFCSPVTNSTIVNEVSDEKFQEVYSRVDGTAQLLNDGRTFETIKPMIFQCALGKNSYSTGIHRIRIKNHYGSVFVGIRSRHIKVETSSVSHLSLYQETPSTYGWYTNGTRVLDGWPDHSTKINVLKKEDTMIELTLNCDEHRLAIVIGEDNSQRDEMKVDGLDAPFPWCLFVQLSRMGARISLV